jgi:adenylate kinase
MLREAIAAGTPMGLTARTIVEAGNLVPDDVMAGMVRERLSAADTARGFLLDGYPRNLGQAVTLESILGGLGWKLDHVLYLAFGDAEIVRRLSGRRTCGGCGAPYHVENAPPRREGTCDSCGASLVQRADDAEDVVKRRLKVYGELTEPLVEFYRRRGLLREIDAAGSVAEVERRCVAALSGATSPVVSGSST